MADEKTNKPVKKTKEPTKAQKLKREVWLAMYRTAQVDFYMKGLTAYGLQMDKRMCFVSAVFLAILTYILPAAKTSVQMWLWSGSALTFFLCLFLMIISTKYSMDALSYDLQHLCAYKKLKKNKKKIKETNEESDKAYKQARGIDQLGFGLVAVGGALFFAFIISVFATGGF